MTVIPQHAFSSEIKWPKEMEELFKGMKKEAKEEGVPINTPDIRKPRGEKGRKYEEKIQEIMAKKKKRDIELGRIEEDGTKLTKLYESPYSSASGANFEEIERNKEKPKPLVVLGPPCAGKTSLINELKYDKPQYFEHILCYTTRPYTFKNEAEWADYLRPIGVEDDEKFFATQNVTGDKPIWFYNYTT